MVALVVYLGLPIKINQSVLIIENHLLKGYSCKNGAQADHEAFPGLKCLAANLDSFFFFFLHSKRGAKDNLGASWFGVLSVPLQLQQAALSRSLQKPEFQTGTRKGDWRNEPCTAAKT